MKLYKIHIISTIILSLISLNFCLDNGLGLTPPMGFNTWNHFGCNISEEIIKNAAHALIKAGLREKGYNYINLDDCWQIARDPTTKKIIEDKEKFPSGIKALADYIHSLDLKFGLYSSAGTFTCQGRPGGLDFEDIDAQTYTEWGVDYFKYDNCFNELRSSHDRYPKMRDAIKAAGGKIFYSLCQWGEENSPTWADKVGNSWRTTQDISNNHKSFLHILDAQNGLEKYARPGAWNDPDMLEVGNGGMTDTEYQSHFALWAILKAPMIIGCDLTKMSEETQNILGNEEVIGVNQDPLGVQAGRISRSFDFWGLGYMDIFSGRLQGGSWVVLFHNRSSRKRTMSIELSKIDGNLKNGFGRDLINRKDIGNLSGEFEADVESHGVVMVKITNNDKEFLRSLE